MKRRKIPWIVLLTLMTGAIFLNACSSTTTATPTTEEIEPEPTNTLEVVVTEVPEVTAEVEVVSECISCHQDKDRLIDTADPVVEAVEENEGAG